MLCVAVAHFALVLQWQQDQATLEMLLLLLLLLLPPLQCLRRLAKLMFDVIV